jgi:hypothetical protein
MARETLARGGVWGAYIVAPHQVGSGRTDWLIWIYVERTPMLSIYIYIERERERESLYYMMVAYN